MRTDTPPGAHVAKVVPRKLLPWFEGVFTGALRTARGRLSVARIERALRRKDASILVSPALWEDVEREALKEFERVSRRAIERAGKKEYLRLKLRGRFDIDNPLAEKYARTRGAMAVTRVTAETRQAIRTIVARGFVEGIPPIAQARQIRNLIGLLPRHAKAVASYQNGLLAAGRKAEDIDRMTGRYSQRLLNFRARMIARTETISASAEGAQESWLQAANEGLIDRETVKRRWIAAVPSERTCPICEELHGQEVGLDEDFRSAVLGSDVHLPTAHVNCRCSVGLVTR